MKTITVFEFPTMNDGIVAIESKYCEILAKVRHEETIEPEVADWMDWANTILQTV